MQQLRQKLMEAVKSFVTALYHQDHGTLMEVVQFNVMTNRKEMSLIVLSPTSDLYKPTLTLLWKTADQQGLRAQNSYNIYNSYNIRYREEIKDESKKLDNRISASYNC